MGTTKGVLNVGAAELVGIAVIVIQCVAAILYLRIFFGFGLELPLFIVASLVMSSVLSLVAIYNWQRGLEFIYPTQYLKLLLMFVGGAAICGSAIHFHVRGEIPVMLLFTCSSLAIITTGGLARAACRKRSERRIR